jgi:Na+-driven multidrug efflux pump
MIKKILVLAGPSMLTVFLEISVELINTLYIGRSDDPTMLAALGFSHIIYHLIAINIMFGAN